MCNSVNIYQIITYFISFESNFSALQESIIPKSRAEHPFYSLGHGPLDIAPHNDAVMDARNSGQIFNRRP